MLVLLIFSSFNGIEAQIKQKTHAESPKKRLTMEAIKTYRKNSGNRDSSSTAAKSHFHANL